MPDLAKMRRWHGCGRRFRARLGWDVTPMCVGRRFRSMVGGDLTLVGVGRRFRAGLGWDVTLVGVERRFRAGLGWDVTLVGVERRFRAKVGGDLTLMVEYAVISFGMTTGTMRRGSSWRRNFVGTGVGPMVHGV
ncbi:hypothetical protein JS531_01690 [Bifidobacterium sp. CP2]|uniref:hypothetical protein n=1 Tax=Bifidobacterium sp. CP2 TaxID=2809025 RepID=UPI001BDC5B99|nr:hypothetical protein [Bifidobacterium sp. CP2]MBT1180708.1 hypothetical protein [Bifidobacterium sp. CP2]